MRYLFIRTLRKGIMIVLSLSFLLPAKAQTEDLYHVRWIGEYPGEKGNKSQSFGDRVSRI